MFSLLLRCSPAQEDELVAELNEAGTAGISEEPGALRAFFEDDAGVTALLDRFAAYEPRLRREDDTDWEQVTRDAWPPIAVGERLFLVAPWNTDPAPVGRLRLEIYPGMACGTGRHPCTQLCLEALERTIQPGMTVLDVGSGSGILSDAARLLGAGTVIGCDIDYDAVAMASERAQARLFVGSADAVRSGSADVIVANISSLAAEELATEFARVRRPDSRLIVSGFPEDDLPQGFERCELLRRDGWACLIC